MTSTVRLSNAARSSRRRSRSLIPGEELDLRPPRWRLPVAFLLLVVLFGTAVWASVGQLTANSNTVSLPRVVLPPVADLDIATASKKITDLGVTVNVVFEPSEGRAQGIVFGQRPDAGAKVEQGDIVTIRVSDGRSGQPIPNVVGQQGTDAQVALTTSGFSASLVSIASDTVRLGEVISMSPPPGQKVIDGSPVLLTVSSGPPLRNVPDVAGKNINNFMVDLGRGGFGIGVITKVSSKDQAEGTVISSDPPAGTPVARDYPVKLTVVGSPPTFRAPYLVGARQASAEAALRALGLGSGVVVVAVGVGDPNDGKVTAQSIPGGSPVTSGITVTITVSSSGTPPAPVAPMIPTTLAPR